MTEYVAREVEVVNLPLGKALLLHPERCVGRIDGKTVDFGALCYRRRNSVMRRGKCGSSFVDLDTFERARISKVRRLIEQVSLEIQSSGRRKSTVLQSIKDFIRFADWCDGAGQFGMFGSERDARQSFRSYVEHLRHRVNTDDLNVQTAIQYQSCAAYYLEGIVGADNVTHGVRLLRFSQTARTPTSPPDEESQSKVLSLCHAIFSRVAAFVLECEPYPIQLMLPERLGWKANALWVFPTIKYFMAPDELSRRDKNSRGFWVYDYANGRLSTPEFLAQKYLRNQKTVLNKAQQRLLAANQDPRHWHRLTLAMLAHDSFVLLFMANTGMNLAEARRLRWSENCEVGHERQGFREIKFRAKGKTVAFEIEANFLATLKRFLHLRDYLADGRDCKTLFLTLGPNNKEKPRSMGERVLNNLFKQLRRIDPTLPRILARQWRAAKSDYLIRNTDPESAAVLLGNSLSTVLRSYAAGSETHAIGEMSDFYRNLGGILREAGEAREDGEKDSALGGCKEVGSPVAIDADPSIRPDCHQTEGCLFCEKYFVHADERDVRKLISCRSCIYRTAHFSNSEEHFQSMYGEVLRRIAAILSEISAKTPGHERIVERIQTEVEEQGLFDPYWERKMQMLIELGAVSA